MTFDKAADAGGFFSIAIGVLSWAGAHIPQFVQGATLILTVLLIVKHTRAYLRGQWDREQ